MNRELRFKNNLVLKRVIFILMVIITFFAIFNFSAQEGIKSSSLSKKVTYKMVSIFIKNEARINKITNRLEPIVRKLAHFSIYTIVGFSLMGFFCTFDIKNVVKFIFSLLLGAIYACSDEIHQLYVADRGGNIIDVGIDSLGVITGIFLMIFLIIIFNSLVEWFKK